MRSVEFPACTTLSPAPGKHRSSGEGEGRKEGTRQNSSQGEGREAEPKQPMSDCHIFLQAVPPLEAQEERASKFRQRRASAHWTGAGDRGMPPGAQAANGRKEGRGRKEGCRPSAESANSRAEDTPKTTGNAISSLGNGFSRAQQLKRKGEISKLRVCVLPSISPYLSSVSLSISYATTLAGLPI